MKCHRLLPHGAYGLIPIALSSMAFWSLLVQDGCDYAQLHGTDMIETITGTSVYPFLEVGRRGYRAPVYDTGTTTKNTQQQQQQKWVMAYTHTCTSYDDTTTTNNNNNNNSKKKKKIQMDAAWHISKWCTFTAFFLGGAVTLFLWCTTVLSLSIRTWRFCGLWIVIALLGRVGGFLFFATHTCQASSSTSSSSNCTWMYGAQMDVAGVIAWFLAAVVMFYHYPPPSPHQNQQQQQKRTTAAANGSSRSFSSSSGSRNNSARGDGLMRDGGGGGGGGDEERMMLHHHGTAEFVRSNSNNSNNMMTTTTAGNNNIARKGYMGRPVGLV